MKAMAHVLSSCDDLACELAGLLGIACEENMINTAFVCVC